MKYRKTQSLTGVILVGFCVMFFFCFVHGFFSYQAIRQLSDLTSTIHDHPLVVSNASLRANADIIKMHRGMRDVVLFGDSQVVDETLPEINGLEIQILKEFRKVQENILCSDGARIASEATQLFKDWKPIREKVIRLVNEGKAQEAAMVTRTQGAEHVAMLEAKMSELTIYVRNKSLGFLKQTQDVRSKVNTRSAVMLAALIVFMSGIAFVTVRKTRSMEWQLSEEKEKLLESEETFRLLSDNTLDVIWTMNLDLEFTYINRACLDITGYMPEEWIGSHLQDHCDSYNFNQMVGIIINEIENVREGRGVIFETVMLKKNGDPVPMEIHGKVIYDENDQPVRIQGVSRDITERKRVEKILRMNEERFSTIFRANPEAIALVRIDDNHLIDVNKTWEKMTGYTREEAIGRNPLELNLWVHPEQREQLVDMLKKQGTAKIETQIRNKFGEVGEALMSAEIIELNDERYLLTMAQDITERKQAEKALRYQEQLLQDMGSLAKVGGWEFDPATGKGTWTEQVAHIYELDPADGTNLEIGMRYHQGESRRKIETAIRDAIELGKPYDLELELVTARGNHKWVRTIGQPKMENGQVVHVRGSFQDITAQKRSEQRIDHLNRVLRAIRDVNHLIVHERDPEMLIREACRLVVHHRGYASALIVLTDDTHKPVSWAESGLGGVFEPMTAMFVRGQLPPCCASWPSPDGLLLIDDREKVCGDCPALTAYPDLDALCVRLVHDGVTFGYFIVSIGHRLAGEEEERALYSEMATDLAYALSFSKLEKARETAEQERRSLENQLRQAQKMESVGRLAGGVAHDFNNILGVIMGSAELAMEKTAADDPLNEFLKDIFNAANRSTKITRQLLAFARQQPISPQVIDLNDTVESMLKMLRRLIGEDIDLAWLPETVLWPVRMDPSQLDQILANLCVNARDAITDVGRVTIETDRVTFDEDYCAGHVGFIPGDFIMLAVSDDGCGMDKATLDIIFEPFFTTKELGQGTGLGLSTVYGIVKQNDGFINVYSEPEKGTTFKIYLPRHAGEVVDDNMTAKKELKKGSGETILVVEDDIALLHLVESILVSLGYTVLTAQTPTAAMQLAETFKEDIYLVITDVIMPEMNGRKLAQQLQTLYPDLKCLFMSGYTANVIAHRGILDEGVRFLQKPFSMSELAVKVKEALGGSI